MDHQNTFNDVLIAWTPLLNILVTAIVAYVLNRKLDIVRHQNNGIHLELLNAKAGEAFGKGQQAEREQQANRDTKGDAPVEVLVVGATDPVPVVVTKERKDQS